MIQKQMIGRLGNQFFQYATIRAYMEKYGIKDKLYFNFDLCRNGDGVGFDDALKNFNVLSYSEINKIKYTFDQKILVFFIKAIEKIIVNTCGSQKKEYYLFQFEKKIQKFINYYGIFWVRNGYIPFSECKRNKNNLIFYGFFESPKYFDDIKDILRIEFSPKTAISESNIKLGKKLFDEGYTCISIRRGDFVTNEKFKNIHFICDNTYFYGAMELLKEKVKKCKYFVCSDDVEWCEKNIKFNGETIFENKNNTLVDKIFLMTKCKNFIISNSTFSWWVQYLSEEKNVVIAPSMWRKNDYTLDKFKNDIYEDKWLILNVGGSHEN